MSLHREGGGMEKSSISHKSSSSGGVAVLFSRGFLPSSCVTENIIEGRLLKIQAVFENEKMTFINVYAPTIGTERVFFLDILKTVVNNCSGEGYLFLGGDFNYCKHNSRQEPSRTTWNLQELSDQIN